MDEVMLKSGTWPNVAIEAGSDLVAMKPAPVENRSVFDEPEEPEATPAQFAEAPKVILNGESYELDTREQLEAELNDLMIKTWQASSLDFYEVDELKSRLVKLLDRQAEITEREYWHNCCQNHVDYDEEYKPAIDELTAKLCRERKIREYAYNKLNEMFALDGKRVKRINELTAERDQLKHDNSLLQSTIAELSLKVDEKQAELLEAHASSKADPVEIQLALARFADEWTTTDTRAQEQRLITYYAQHIADLVDNHTENA